MNDAKGTGLMDLSMMELKMRLEVARQALKKAVVDGTEAGRMEAERQVFHLENAVRDKARQIASVVPESQTVRMKPAALAGGSERVQASNAARPGDSDSPVARVIESRGMVRFLCRCGVEVTIPFDTGELGHVTCECGKQYGAQAVVMLTNRGRITRR